MPERELSGGLVAIRIAVLAKQIPRFEDIASGANGRLRRHGVELEMNAYCRRAVSKGAELAGDLLGTCTVFTLGPPAAQDVLREAIAWGASAGVLITDPAFAGSDTLATARALAAAVSKLGPFDLVLTGLNSVDADTGQVGPELAELLGMPFVAGVRSLELDAGTLRARCEGDNGWSDLEVRLPAVVSCAERLCQPAKAPPAARAAVDASLITRLSAADLGPGPWGDEGSPTRVGALRMVAGPRAGRVLAGPVGEQVAEAVALLAASRGLEASRAAPAPDPVPQRVVRGGGGPPAVVVAAEPGNPRATQLLLGSAARLAAGVGGQVALWEASADTDPGAAASWGADEVVRLDRAGDGAAGEEDIAAALAGWCRTAAPWAVLAPATRWGREVAGRVAARLGAGLIGDSLEPELAEGRLVAWKPAFGGQMVAAITTSSPVQLVTVRSGALPERTPREPRPIPVTRVPAGAAAGRVRKVRVVTEDDTHDLHAATTVIGVGRGVQPHELDLLEPLRAALAAQVGATRGVTDDGWLPRSRQIGITGHSISPRLYVAVGIRGKFNHMIGVRGADTVLAINSDPAAPVFTMADIGIVADWRDVVRPLAEALLPWSLPTPNCMHGPRASGGALVTRRSGPLQEPEVEHHEHRDDRDVYYQPRPELVPEE
jgi:electron transfer flavoprotein alpha subunit